MEIKTLAKKSAIVIAVLLIGYILQLLVCSNIKIANIAPNLMMVLLSTFAFHFGSKSGMFIGFFSGLLMDLYSGYYLGADALIFTFIGFLTGYYSIILMADDIKSNLLIVAVNDLIYGLFFWIIHSISSGAFLAYYLKAVIMPEIMYTLIVALILYYPILKVISLFNQIDTRAGSRLEG